MPVSAKDARTGHQSAPITPVKGHQIIESKVPCGQEPDASQCQRCQNRTPVSANNPGEGPPDHRIKSSLRPKAILSISGWTGHHDKNQEDFINICRQ
jgi:hypothetical protein